MERNEKKKRSKPEHRSFEKTQEDAEQMQRDVWKPKTSIGRKTKSGEINNIHTILDSGKPILEEEIVLTLLPNMESELLAIGQSKGKFGGGKRKAFRQTQKKMEEGNKISFATFAVVGNGNGYVGIGYGKSKETIPAREKALRNAKLNIIKIRRGCGSWKCNCNAPHSIPYAVKGRCGSAEIILMPAPKGTGLIVEKECQKILKLAGIKDVWSKSRGQTRVKVNLVKACMASLQNLIGTKIQTKHISKIGITEGAAE